jgi:hypothetical protein
VIFQCRLLRYKLAMTTVTDVDSLAVCHRSQGLQIIISHTLSLERATVGLGRHRAGYPTINCQEIAEVLQMTQDGPPTLLSAWNKSGSEASEALLQIVYPGWAPGDSQHELRQLSIRHNNEYLESTLRQDVKGQFVLQSHELVNRKNRSPSFVC